MTPATKRSVSTTTVPGIELQRPRPTRWLPPMELTGQEERAERHHGCDSLGAESETEVAYEHGPSPRPRRFMADTESASTSRRRCTGCRRSRPSRCRRAHSSRYRQWCRDERAVEAPELTVEALGGGRVDRNDHLEAIGRDRADHEGAPMSGSREIPSPAALRIVLWTEPPKRPSYSNTPGPVRGVGAASRRKSSPQETTVPSGSVERAVPFMRRWLGSGRGDRWGSVGLESPWQPTSTRREPASSRLARKADLERMSRTRGDGSCNLMGADHRARRAMHHDSSAHDRSRTLRACA